MAVLGREAEDLGFLCGRFWPACEVMWIIMPQLWCGRQSVCGLCGSFKPECEDMGVLSQFWGAMLRICRPIDGQTEIPVTGG